MKVFNSIDELVGKTPILRLNNIEQKFNLKARLFAKLEYLNPAGSIKDRVAKSMIDCAEQDGYINKDTLIIEPTSGNTGIGLASICAARGYKLVLTMPETMSKERIALLKAYGAQVVLTDGKKGMVGAVEKAEQIHKENDNSFIPGQFVNMNNPKAHVFTTGPEIYNDLDGQIDYLIAGIGTGGTITGLGEYLKSRIAGIKVVAVEPASSPLLSKGQAGAHSIQGIGANFIPKILDTDVYDEIATVSNDDAINYAKEFGICEGFLVGISSGAALSAAIEVASKIENENKNIVIILPDSGDRYLSTKLFE